MKALPEAIKSCRKGNLEMYGDVVEALQSRAISYAFHIMGNYTDAEDAAQESFVRAWQKLGSLRNESAFLTWFYRILSNNIRRKFRAERKMENLEDRHYSIEDPGMDPQVVFQRRELQEKVREAIRSLPHHSRAVLLLRDMEEFSYEEISRILQIPLGTVKSRLYLAREHLQKALMEKEGMDAQCRAATIRKS